MPRFLDYMLDPRKDPPWVIYNASYVDTYQYPAIIAGLKSEFRGAVPIAADNIDEFAMHHIIPKAGQRGRWVGPEDFPNILPPHPVCWIDWKSSDPYVRQRQEWTGVHVEASRVADGAPGGAGYVLSMRVYWKLRHMPHVWVNPVLVCVAVDDSGNIVRYGNMRMEHVTMSAEEAEVCTQTADNWCLSALLTYSFMNCKNVVVWTEDQEPKLEKAYHKRHGRYLERYKCIDIVPMSKIVGNRPSDDAGSDHALRALHIVRGHFKTYNGDSKLFGKYTGTYFWGQATRGTGSAGEIHRSYRIKIGGQP